MKIFCLYDKKSGEYFAISVWPNEELFKRSLVGMVNDDKNENNLLSRFSSDFDLFCLGTFDPKSGELVYNSSFICCAADLKEHQ